MVTDILLWSLAGIAIFTILPMVSTAFQSILERYFKAAIRLKLENDKKSFTGLKKVNVYLFALGFVLLDFYYRNTVIVSEFRVLPKFELVTTFIQRLTGEPGNYEIWQLARADHYRTEIIEPIDPKHFKGKNVARTVLNNYYQI